MEGCIVTHETQEPCGVGDGPAPETKLPASVTTDTGSTDTEARPLALYDLPVFAWAWREDGRDLRA